MNCLTSKECETYYLQFGGESSNTTRDRMVQTLIDIMNKDNHCSVLAVSHSGAYFNFLRAWQDPMKEFEKGFPHCCIFIYEYENSQFQLIDVMRQDI